MLNGFDKSTKLEEKFAEAGNEKFAEVGARAFSWEAASARRSSSTTLDTGPSLKIILESGSGLAIDLVPDDVYP